MVHPPLFNIASNWIFSHRSQIFIHNNGSLLFWERFDLQASVASLETPQGASLTQKSRGRIFLFVQFHLTCSQKRPRWFTAVRASALAFNCCGEGSSFRAATSQNASSVKAIKIEREWCSLRSIYTCLRCIKLFSFPNSSSQRELEVMDVIVFITTLLNENGHLA